MKRLCEDDTQSGLETLIGEKVLLLCMNYFYHGKLEALSDTDAELSDAGIVYETGRWSEAGFSDRQELPANVFVKISAIEAYLAVA